MRKILNRAGNYKFFRFFRSSGADGKGPQRAAEMNAEAKEGCRDGREFIELFLHFENHNPTRFIFPRKLNAGKQNRICGHLQKCLSHRDMIGIAATKYPYLVIFSAQSFQISTRRQNFVWSFSLFRRNCIYKSSSPTW